MNVMKRFLLGSNSQSNQNQSETSQNSPSPSTSTEITVGIKPSPSQHAALSLTHLRKLFSDFLISSPSLNDAEKESRIYSMLPLFCRVFSHCSANEMLEKFPEVAAFCQHVSRLAVSEIRKRASNQSTVAASLGIANFLEMNSAEDNSNGWMLLTVLNLLSLGGPAMVEVMTVASIPSTLVKCLYLFFDLPELENPDAAIAGCEFTARERRLVLQKLFGQMLVRLCSNPDATEELARKDDLTLLFSALSSWCPQHNLLWRKNANEVLVVLTKHGLTTVVLAYIHNKGCISVCVENMQKALTDLSPLELVEMFATIFCLLKDSSDATATLLDDFRTCHGYLFITDFLLRTEHEDATESQEAIRNLVFLVSSLTTSGYHELRPMAFSTGSLFQLPNFSVPPPSGKGSSVRNIPAFQVLQNVFVKSGTSALSSIILDAISTIFHSDPANYFILEPQNTLNQFSEKIHLKSPEVQEKFFRLLEFVVFQLNYVPCKELISLSLLLRNHATSHTSCCQHCLVLLLSILRHNTLFKDVYREVGLLEVLVTCLHRFATVMKLKMQQTSIVDEKDAEVEMGYLVMESLSVLLVGNVNNAAIFRESGGARCAHNLIPYPDCRREALCIVQQLILSTGGDDDMGTVLAMLQSAPASDLQLKTDILKALLTCLRESHRTRTMFRKVGGFVYVMSALVSMESSLSRVESSPTSIPWQDFPNIDVLRMLHLIFNTLCVAMRYEPANAKFFQLEVCGPSLCDTVRLLGCFDQCRSMEDLEAVEMDEEATGQHSQSFHQIFNGGVQDYTGDGNEEAVEAPLTRLILTNATLVLRLLYDLAIDCYDRAPVLPSCTTRSNAVRTPTSDTPEAAAASKRHNVASLNLNPSTPDPLVVHPGVILALFRLLPSISSPDSVQASLALQLLVTDIIQSLLNSERNVQILCDAGFQSEILSHSQSILNNESHYLHGPLLNILERLSRQALEPKDFREFLRMGKPLNCLLPENPLSSLATGRSLPLSRLKSLVSMTTPRDVGRHGQDAFFSPPFVEFDMQPEGFGCLFLPSVAPQCHANTVGNLSGAGTGLVIMGGVGSGGDRIFPAQTGMTFSTWICVDKFSDPRLDPHGIRLLTLVRNIMDREENLVCLSVMLSPRDKALLVSTQESPLPKGSSDWEPDVTGDFGARIWNPDLIQEGRWHHLALVWSRAVLKNSQFSLFIDGHLVHTCKMHYISQNPGGGAANLTVASSVFGYIGTAPSWRRQSRLVWRQGPCHLVEDAFHPQTIQWIYKIGPHYIGSLQAPQLFGASESLCSLVNEERIVFGLNASAMSPLTLAKIRKVYRKMDSKSIAKQLGMSTHENATPIRLLHNAAGHLSGPARTLGGVVIGYLGVRVFCPRPICTTLQAVGGSNILLGLVAMATNVESLYAAVKCLVYVVKCNSDMHHEMERLHGYQTLAYLLKRHRLLVNNHVLHLIMLLAGTSDSDRDHLTTPNNSLAFRDLLADLDVWRDASEDLHKVLFDLFYRLSIESKEAKSNTKYLRELNMVSRLLQALQDGSLLSSAARESLWNVLGALLHNNPRPVDLLLFGQYLATTLPAGPGNEESTTCSSQLTVDVKTDDSFWAMNIANRNEGLTLIYRLLSTERGINLLFSEEFFRVLGFDWLFLFMQSHVKSSSVILSLRCLVLMLSSPQYLVKFREEASSAAWTRSREVVSQQAPGKTDVVLGFQVTSPGPLRLVGRTFSVVDDSSLQTQQSSQVPGFHLLKGFLLKHMMIPEVYYLLIGLMVGKPKPKISQQLELDTIWTCLFGVNQGHGMPFASLGGRGVPMYCPEAITLLFTVVRSIMNVTNTSALNVAHDITNYPNVIIQFLFYIYNNVPDYLTVFMTPDVLNAMVACFFPSGTPSEINSESNTPVDDAKQYVLVDSPDSNMKETTLTSHRAKKSMVDFLRTIVVDSLSLPVNNRTVPIIDIIVDACPDSSNYSQQCQFQTELLSTVMEYLISADVILGEQGVLPIVAGGSVSNVATNVFYLAGRLVDKLWQSVLQRNPHEVFDFVVQLIVQAKKRGVTIATLTMDNVYRCLNRCVLFLLSRPADSVAHQMSIMETLHKLTTYRSLVFGSGNHDLEFIGCLTYCLLQLTHVMKITTESTNKTTWHVNPQLNADGEDNATHNSLTEAQNLTSVAAKRVWEEMYISKKPAIEESFKTSLGATNKVPSLDFVRDTLREPSLKLWLSYIEAERRSAYRTVLEVPNQIQSKIQKVTGGLTRLTSRSKTKREESVIRTRGSSISLADVALSTQGHLTALKEQVEVERKNFLQLQLHTDKYNHLNWKRVEGELLRVRGIWGPTGESTLTKWMLDMTEGPCRMRKKLTRNVHFYAQYPYRKELEQIENKSLRYKVATSLDAKEHHKFYAQWNPSSFLLANSSQDQQTIDTLSQSTDGIVPDAVDKANMLQVMCHVSDVKEVKDLPQLKDLPALLTRPKRDQQFMADIDEDSELNTSIDTAGAMSSEDAHEDQPQDSQNLLRLLEDNEKIGHLFKCARVQGLETVDGLLLFGKEHLYVVDGFTQTSARQIRDISNFPAGTFDPIVPPYTTPGYGSPSTSSSLQQQQSVLELEKAVHQCSTIGYEDIREVHKRRYLLQPIALEVFSNDGRNYLLAFPPSVRNKVYQRLLATATGLSDSASQSVAGQKRAANVEQGAGILSTLMGETSVTQRWCRGEISNFQYLMHLNTLAGRSYNDLMQYPVFPWILADYESHELDLNNPATFRDLSRPMGAQTPDRLTQFRKRYKEWDDPHNETGPYHYGTHYSSAMIVCSYLVRLEPFTQQFLQLQGGHFDLADRLFHSVSEAWSSAAKLNMADVKELIPEFFYLPDFLMNANRFDLGVKQSGVALNDVVLPPWAKNDPREFIRVHRSALESDYVSQHLHEWIDLIFGYKQQGPPAVESINLFHPLFYEGNVDIYSIEDPLKKNAVIGFINNFGQTPKQLFKKPHPNKKVARSGMDITLPLAQGLIPLPGAGSSAGGPDAKLFFHHVDHLSPSLQAIKELKRPVGHIVCTDRSILAVEENKFLLPPNFSRCVAWGYADHSLRVVPHDSEKALMVCETSFHQEILTCVCPTAKTVVTGGANTVVTVWELGKKQLTVRQHLYGHTEAVTCLAASAGYQILVSGSRDRTAIVWDLSRSSFIRQLTGHNAPLAAIDINELTGDIATCSGTWLHLWSINGDPLASVNTLVGQIGRSQHLLCVCFSQHNEWDSMNVILTGSTDGVVRMWSLDYVQVPQDESGTSKEVTTSELSLMEEGKKADNIDSAIDPEPETAEIKDDVAFHFDADEEEDPFNTNEVNPEHSKEKQEEKQEGNQEEKQEGNQEEKQEGNQEEKQEGDQQENPEENQVEKQEKQEENQEESLEESLEESQGDNQGESVKLDFALQRLPSLTSLPSCSSAENVAAIETSDCPAALFSSQSSSNRVVMRNKRGEGNSNASHRATICAGEAFQSLSSEFDSLKEVGGEEGDDEKMSTTRLPTLRTSRSDSSLNGTFEVISESEVQESIQNQSGEARESSAAFHSGLPKKSRHVLKEGFKWQKQLIFRTKLTMHTAYDRQDNSDPASVTSIAVSRDHRTVLVGDARGRVHSWSINDVSGRSIADHWLKDDTTESCTKCRVRFSLTERRHHCRNCGHVFCSRCSRYESEIMQLRIRRPVRVCQDCHASLKSTNEATSQ